MLNKVQFIGHLGRDPEVRYMDNGDAVCNFSVAASERWKDKNGEQQEATEWLRVSAFGRLAEVCGEWLRKGSLVYVEGKLKTREYTDKEGVKKFSTECQLREMKMLGGRKSEDEGSTDNRPRSGSGSNAPAPRRQPAGDDMDDDIPF